MAVENQYITNDTFNFILKALNVDSMTEPEQQDLLDRATADVEGDLVERYVVPLYGINGGDYATCPPFARNKVLNAMKAKIKQLIGYDQNRNVIIDSTEKYIDVAKGQYNDCIKVLLDPKKDFKFRQQDYTEGSVDPVQSVGIARADNEPHFRNEDNWVP